MWSLRSSIVFHVEDDQTFKKSMTSTLNESRVKFLAKVAAVTLLGFILPVVILAQAYLGLSTLNDEVAYKQTPADLVNTLTKAKVSLATENDYALFSLLYTEHANQKTMINKQVMKVTIMQIGFAVSSLGLMLIVLGINDGGAEGSTEVKGVKFDFKTGSTGVVVFLAGALMTTAGGILKNEYKTVPIPTFSGSWEHAAHARSLSTFSECRKLPMPDAAACFFSRFKQENGDLLLK